jgi:hypothetical protein
MLRLLSAPTIGTSPIDMGRFLEATFRCYRDIPSVTVDSDDIARLHGFDDARLRKAVASILQGVDPVAAQREADKPHSPAEIADMELPVTIDGKLYYLCMPFKSGIEIRDDRVPVGIAYQVIRPFMFFPHNGVVVFITAKPCSQYLLNYIKAARGTQGWSIEVIQHQELAKLLKLNDLLDS